jgi:hypothetical protein
MREQHRGVAVHHDHLGHFDRIMAGVFAPEAEAGIAGHEPDIKGGREDAPVTSAAGPYLRKNSSGFAVSCFLFVVLVPRRLSEGAGQSFTSEL